MDNSLTLSDFSPASARSLSPRPSMRDRPPLPQGPRTRRRTGASSMEVSTSNSSSDSNPLCSPDPISPPSWSLPPSASSTSSDKKFLSPISESFPPTATATAVVQEDVTIKLPSPSLSPEPIVKTKTIPKVKVTGLTPPPHITFDPIPIQWKGISLEAAQWTYTSKELQSIVSRAIRSSAHVSFIRLLSTEILDHSLPAESERLGTLKAMTQSKYRFQVHRRTMLLQALNSFSLSPGDKHNDGGVAITTRLVSQLSETTAECDRLMEELLQIADQQAQIAKLQDVHWASALAIALRKLNGSYARRTSELVASKEKISQLEGELEDAWKAAEKLAKEIDDMDMDIIGSDDEGEAIIERAEIVAMPKNVETQAIVYTLGKSVPEGSTPAQEPTGTRDNDPGPDPQAVRATTAETEPNLVSDTATIRSFRSARSARSVRPGPGEPSRLNIVSAAKRRSTRTSLGSLRLPNSNSKKQYASLGHHHNHNIQWDPKTPPPVPNLPKAYYVQPPSSFLFFDDDSGSPSTVDGDGVRESDEAEAGYPLPLPLSLATVDDSGSRGARRHTSEDIMRVSRSLATIPPRPVALDDIDLLTRTRPQVLHPTGLTYPYPPSKSKVNPTNTIPSMWLNVDTRTPPPKVLQAPHAQKDEPLAPHAQDDIDITLAPHAQDDIEITTPMIKPTPDSGKLSGLSSYNLNKLKSLTKRYSLPFPMTMTRLSRRSSSSSRPSSHQSQGSTT